jgi:hypothetical protein
VARRRYRVRRWQFVLFMLGVQVVLFAVNGVSSPGEALAYLAFAALLGVACFHAVAALTGRGWFPNVVVALAAGLLGFWIPGAWRRHHHAVAVSRYLESQRHEVHVKCPRDRESAAQAILKRWQAKTAPTWINCASSAPVGTYGNGDRFGEIHSTDICSDVDTTPFYDGGDGSRTLWFLSCRTRVS